MAEMRIDLIRDDRDCLLASLLVVLDQVDYTAGACKATEMVGAVLSTEVIALARTAIARRRA